MRLRERLKAALPAAMKARDSAAVTALRSALAAIENAAAVAPDESAHGRPAVGPGVTEFAGKRRSAYRDRAHLQDQ